MRATSITGGQYSLLRWVLGGFTLWQAAFLNAVTFTEASLLQQHTPWLLAVPCLGAFASGCAAIGGLLILLGKWEIPGVLLAGLVASLLVIADPVAGHLAWLAWLVIHAFTLTRSPFLSLAALDRQDPGGSWVFPTWLATGLVLLLALALSSGLSLTPYGVAFDSSFVALAVLIRVSPPAAWQSHLLVVIFLGLATTALMAPSSIPVLALLVLAMLPKQGPLPQDPDYPKDVLFYDGDCGLCHRAVRFVLAEDRDGRHFIFSPLKSDLFYQQLAQETIAQLPDSLVILTLEGRLHTQADAVMYLAKKLGGAWWALAHLGYLLPDTWRNGLYQGIAQIRHRLFDQPKQSCPIMPVHLRQRFHFS